MINDSSLRLDVAASVKSARIINGNSWKRECADRVRRACGRRSARSSSRLSSSLSTSRSLNEGSQLVRPWKDHKMCQITSKVWFFGSLGRVRRATIGQRRGRARGTPRVELIRRDLAGRLKKCAGNCDRPAEGWLPRDESWRSEGRGSSRK